MNIDRLGLKYLFVVGVVALSLLAVWPPEKRLKPGIDLAGGTSLLYEIDTAGLDDDQIPDIADRVITQLRQRVDPGNQRNLVWRKVGRTRIEIQMPGTTGKLKEQRESKDAAIDGLLNRNWKRGVIEAVLDTPAENRDATIQALLAPLTAAGGKAAELATQRRTLLEDLFVRRDALQTDSSPDALTAFDAALDALLQTNMDHARLLDVLGMPAGVREEHIKALAAKHPGYAEALPDVMQAFDAWHADRGMLEDGEDLKRLLRGAGVLEFRILAQTETVDVTRLDSRAPELRQSVDEYVEQLEKRGPRYRQGKPYQWFLVPQPVAFFNATNESEVAVRASAGRYVAREYAGKTYVLAYDDPRYCMLKKKGDAAEGRWKLKQAWAGRDYESGGQIVNFRLDARGGDLFARLTGENTQRPLGVFLDNGAMTVANILGRIHDSGVIQGEFSSQEIAFLVNTLEAGSLPARLKEPPLSERSVGASLGQTNLKNGFRSVVFGFVAVAAFMLIYYMLAGVVANIALILNLLLVLAFMATLEATFTLPGIAGLILTVGMAVDANVLIFERIREELQRGASIKLALKNGYEKAFSTILDANVTTLITCIILGYAGSEEVKGFAIVLGLGVVFSMFTALWVTRWVFAGLAQAGIIKKLPMLQLVRSPDINWIEMRRFFWPASMVVVLAGGALFAFEHATNKSNIYDIEFLGGTAVTVELKDATMTDAQVRNRVVGTGRENAAGWLQHAAEQLPAAQISKTRTAGVLQVHHPEFTAEQIQMMVMTTLSDKVESAGQGFRQIDTHTIEVSFKETSALDDAALKAELGNAAAYLVGASERLRTARVQIDHENTGTFDINTTEPEKEVIRQAIVQVMQDELKVQRPISYTVRTEPGAAPDGFYPISPPEEHSGTLRLRDVIGGDSAAEIDAFRGGVALVFQGLQPAEGQSALQERFRTASLLPEFEQYEYRDFKIVPLAWDPNDAQLAPDQRRVTSFALLVSDHELVYEDDVALWESELARPELDKVSAALGSKKTLQKVETFAPQIAADHTAKAVMAIILALVMIVAYIGIRFGEMRFGLAAIVALVHDVSISLGAVAASYYISGALGYDNVLGIQDFKIDLAMIGAFLTIVGYSLNDTIVTFDRIRENRGRTTTITTQLVNLSINQTLSRTLLTSVTTLVAVVIMYAVGGAGIRGFSYCLIVGVIVGTYSSIAVATPLVLNPRLLTWIIHILTVGALLTMLRTLEQPELRVLVWILALAYAGYLFFTLVLNRKPAAARELARA